MGHIVGQSYFHFFKFLFVVFFNFKCFEFYEINSENIANRDTGNFLVVFSDDD